MRHRAWGEVDVVVQNVRHEGGGRGRGERITSLFATRIKRRAARPADPVTDGVDHLGT